MGGPTEDLVSDLAERVNAEEISVREAAQLATGVLIAGHETTANMISLSIAALLDHPDQLALLRDAEENEGPEGVAAAVEELMRISTSSRPASAASPSRTSRSAARPSAPVRASSSTWPRRTGTPVSSTTRTSWTCCAMRAHAWLRLGRHQCVGQQLARMELQIVLPTLFRRIPSLRLAVPVEQLPFKHDALAYGIYQLPVTW